MSRGQKHYISSKKLSLEDLQLVIVGAVQIDLAEDAKIKINRCREYLDEKILNTREPIYGINTGFGSYTIVIFRTISLKNFRKI